MRTEMYEVEPHETDALLLHLLGDGLEDPDALRRYHALTRAQAVCQAASEEIARLRGRALAEMKTGRSAREVAELVGIGSRQRVEQLIAGAQS
ncbi:MAG: hypothetical protein IRY85_14925 [Micromonosporaceae bacterium]|nr:hypothetical protein [Micromonosporaceae bacterium]